MDHIRTSPKKGGLAEIFSFPSLKKECASWRQEVLGGALTVLLLLASLAVVPMLWAKVGLPFAAAYASTLIAAFAATLFLGLLAQQPLVVAPALGVNIWLIYGVIYAWGVPWQSVLMASFTAAILYFITVLSPLWRILLTALPAAILQAMRGGIGLLIIFMGLQMAKIVVGSPLTVTMLGSLSEPAAFVSLVGLFTALALWAMGVNQAAFWGAFVAIVLAFGEGFLALPNDPFLLPAAPYLAAWSLESSYLLELSGVILTLWLIFIFDSFAIFTALGKKGELGESAAKRTFFVIALANVAASLLGAGPLALAKESAAARSVGAHTPFVAYAAACLIFFLLFIEPVAAAVLDFSAVFSPLFIFSGCHLLRGLRLDWQEMSEHTAFFAVLVVTPLSFNLAAGFGAGLLFYVFLEIFAGRGKMIHPLLFFLTGAFLFCIWFTVIL